MKNKLICCFARYCAHGVALPLTILLSSTISGCASLRDSINPPGEMREDGRINPCHGYQSNPQACGNAIYNADHVVKLGIGQTLVEARQIMGRDPEERSLKKQGEQTVEVWKYLTVYRSTTYSVITFIDGKIVSIESTK